MWRVDLLASMIAGVTGSLVAYVTVKLTVAERVNDRHVPLPGPVTHSLTGEEVLEFPTGDTPGEKLIYFKTP